MTLWEAEESDAAYLSNKAPPGTGIRAGLPGGKAADVDLLEAVDSVRLRGLLVLKGIRFINSQWTGLAEVHRPIKLQNGQQICSLFVSQLNSKVTK